MVRGTMEKKQILHVLNALKKMIIGLIIFNALYLKNGVTIGQTESEVIKILGTPTESHVGDDEGDTHDTFTIY